jgi:hypothetical protein
MDQRRFDDLARNLGATNSRRNVLKGIVAGVVSGFAGAVAGGGALAAKGGNGKGPHKPDCCPSTLPRLCSNTCVDPSSDPNNCGDCGNACPANATCQNGACMCPSGMTLCGNVCVDTSSDANNCGMCGNACASGESCVNGSCQQINCDDGNPCTADTFDAATQQCVHTPANDGAVCETSTGSGICSNGVCVENAECTPGATQSCYTGPASSMGVGICQAGVQICDASGHWGSCMGEVTPTTETCNGLDDDCDGKVDNGFDLQTDVNNCGQCGHQCVVVNGVAGCVNGQCVIVQCNAGWGDCNGDPADGCETNTLTNPANCGACGNVCSSGMICVNGVCAAA